MLQLIPMPAEIQRYSGVFSMTADTSYTAESHFSEAAEFLESYFKKLFGTAPEEKETGDIKFFYAEDLAKEAYRLSISANRIQIEASAPAGALYALQTLRQLGDFDLQENPEEIQIPCVEIVDYPRYSWRGQMLDCSRHFFSTEEIKRLLDLMLYHKLNVFHWHLTDDQGWRMESKKYPLLTEIGSKRKNTQQTGWMELNYKLEGKPHEGFYTQEEIRDIVAYAAKRGIMVVPEIDMPAHFAAAEAAYPYLACREMKSEVFWWYSGIVPHTELGYKDSSWNRPACLGKESTYTFIFDILDEVCELFPAPYFHIGGDESPTAEWKKCPHCQKKMQEEHLETPRELQGYFTNCVGKYLKTKGKSLIGWNEVLDSPNIDRSVVGQYWTSKRSKAAERHIKKGGKLILSRHNAFYFDFPHSKVQLKNTYTFDPKMCHIQKNRENQVLGVEAELWTEFVADRRKLDFNLFPRMGAVSENAWTPKQKCSFRSFQKRLPHYEAVLQKLGVNYAPEKITLKNHNVKYTHAFYFKNPYLEVEDGEAAKRGIK